MLSKESGFGSWNSSPYGFFLSGSKRFNSEATLGNGKFLPSMTLTFLDVCKLGNGKPLQGNKIDERFE